MMEAHFEPMASLADTLQTEPPGRLADERPGTSLAQPAESRPRHNPGPVIRSSPDEWRQQAEAVQAANPLAWPAAVRAARRQITYFEQQSQMRCLQHAYNNLWGGEYLRLSGEEAQAGADLGLVCGLAPPGHVPMLRLTLDGEQLSALTTSLVEQIDRMIVFAGDPNSGAGHYQALRKIDGHHFLFDSLRNEPQWLPNPTQYFQQIQHSTRHLMAAIPQNSSPAILQYMDFLSHHVSQDVSRALGDLYGTQPIAALSDYLAARGIINPDAHALAGFFQAQGMQASAGELAMPSVETMRNMDEMLSAMARPRTKVLLLTRTHPYLIPAFFDDQRGAWQARVPAADAKRMESRSLREVLQTQQDAYDEQCAQADTAERRGGNCGCPSPIRDGLARQVAVQLAACADEWEQAPSIADTISCRPRKCGADEFRSWWRKRLAAIPTRFRPAAGTGRRGWHGARIWRPKPKRKGAPLPRNRSSTSWRLLPPP